MIIQLRLLSGRARLGSLLRHFSPTNNGMCELCHLEIEDLSHFLLPRCPLLHDRSQMLLEYMRSLFKNSETCLLILDDILAGSRQNHKLWVQFVLDCSVLPAVIVASQDDPVVLFRATRTPCYSLRCTSP